MSAKAGEMAPKQPVSLVLRDFSLSLMKQPLLGGQASFALERRMLQVTWINAARLTPSHLQHRLRLTRAFPTKQATTAKQILYGVTGTVAAGEFLNVIGAKNCSDLSFLSMLYKRVQRGVQTHAP